MHELQERHAPQIQEMVRAANRLAELQYVTSHGGNLSLRVQEDVALITPTKVAKGDLTFDDICAVALDGRVWTGRDRLHKFLAEGGGAPVPLRDGALYHCGPVVVETPEGWKVLAAGPTTSSRENPYMPRIIEEHGVRVIIGKGGMNAAVQAACARFGCVYLQAVGGAAALIARHVTRVAGVYLLDEFGAAEAMWELELVDMPLTVGIDANGGNLYQEVATASRKKLEELLA